MKGTRAEGGQRGARRYILWPALDVILIGVFALLGHLSHYREVSPGGVIATAAPFLLAYLIATALCMAWRRPVAVVRTAVPLWLGTAVGGLVLRVATGESAALAFQIVSLITLGLFLVLPRALTALVLRYSRRSRALDTLSPNQNQGAAT